MDRGGQRDEYGSEPGQDVPPSAPRRPAHRSIGVTLGTNSEHSVAIILPTYVFTREKSCDTDIHLASWNRFLRPLIPPGNGS